MAPETSAQRRANVKHMVDDIFEMNGEFAENKLRGEFFKAIWGKLKMNWLPFFCTSFCSRQSLEQAQDPLVLDVAALLKVS